MTQDFKQIESFFAL